jgi:AcrR family transcriptional regulator
MTTEMDGRRLRGEKARARVLARSTVIASTDGLEGLTIGRVAVDAGISKSNITVLFGDKEALQLATLERAVEMFDEAVVQPALRKPTPLARLRALTELWFAFVEKRTLPGGCFITAVSSEYRTRPGRIRDRINEHRASGRARMRKLIREAKACGQIRTDADEAQLVFDLFAYQAAANVAALMGDEEQFERARRTTRKRIRSVAVEGKRQS